MGSVLKTALHNLHLESGANMVDFAGYKLPVQYPTGIKKEHLYCRSSAALFDVSHMGQLIVQGKGVIADLEKLLPTSLEQLAQYQHSYSLLTNPQGGILDDVIISRWDEERFFIVVNGACKHQDIAHIKQHLSTQIKTELLDQYSLLAVQGPKAKDIMKQLCPETETLVFMNGCRTDLLGEKCYISRAGYTGEDGFEISVPDSKAETLAKRLLEFDEVKMAGLGARDSLRLEAGLCLYGNDMDENTTPVEASLSWAISKSRRNGETGNFLGAPTILKQLEEGVSRKRVGLKIEGRVPAREGAEVQNSQGDKIGHVCSGAITPSLEYPIAMAYITSNSATVNNTLQVVVRNKTYLATVVKMPFVPTHYYRN